MTSRRHQRRAALPGAGYTRPSSLDPTGLIVTVFGESSGVEGTFDFTTLPGSIELRRAFAAALDRKSGPSGTWRSGETCRNGYWALRAFLEYLGTRDDAPSSTAEISPAIWAAWRLSLPNNHTARNRLALLRTVLPLVQGLPADTLTAIDRRIPQSPHPTEIAYSYDRFEQIRSQAAATFNTALVRIRGNREHLRRWYAGEYASGSTDWVIGEALDAILRTGDVPRYGGRADVLHRHAHVLGGRGADKTWARLFLTGPEAFALAVLLVASEGWNRSVLHRMHVPGHDPAVGDDEFDIQLVEIHKRRRPVRLRYTSNNLVDTGPDSPGRLMRHAIEATELARQTLELLGRPTGQLLVSRRTGTPDDPFCLGIPGPSVVARWSIDAGLSTPKGTPLRVSLRRIRRTVQVLIRKQPAQNTEETHDSVYMLRDPASRAEAQQTIAQGLTDALDHAHTVVKMRIMLGDNANELIELSDDPDLARAIQRGDMDTATTACADFFDSPFTDEPGQPCTASFLWCLRCENAIVTRRHLPRLVYLHRGLNELRGTVDQAVWDQDWREHFHRLHLLLAEHTTTTEQAVALRAISDTDRTLIDRLLHRRLDT
ncbi:hypothetical protein FXW78_54630 [Rhodococcus opacus]|nr:hypothetical protein [Rhodococcus opacus]MDT2010260.1 hypothetical protein [Rhodococcus opacus]